MMTHRFRPLVIVVVVLLIAVAGVTAFALRGRLAAVPYVGRAFGRHQTPPADPATPSRRPAAMADMTNMTNKTAKAASASEVTPRGDVTIDPRRQQLIG